MLPSGSRNQGDPTINSYNQKAKHKANQTITLTAVITRSVEQCSEHNVHDVHSPRFQDAETWWFLFPI